MQGELVSVETADGVVLDGILQRPAHGQDALPVDIFILHHGVANNFYHHPMFAALSRHLLADGCAALCVNSRGHDTVYVTTVHGQTRRLGAAYEIVDDCRLDWDAWTRFAAAQGFQRIGVWGHSLGAVKSIYYAALQPDPRVLCTVASSPPRQAYENYLAQPDHSAYDHDFQLAQEAMDAGDPERLIETIDRRRTIFTARTWLDKYGPGSRYDIFALIPQVTSPLLVTWGELEPLPSNPNSVSFHQLPQEAPRLAAEQPRARFAEVPGADHFYSNRRDQLYGVVRDWLTTAL